MHEVPQPPPRNALVLACTLAVGLVLLTHPFIDLGLALDLPLPGGRTWAADAPVADVAALVLLPLCLLAVLRTPGPRPVTPGLAGWGLLLLASAASIHNAIDPQAALHHLVRKPLLVYLLYGLGLSWAVARLLPGPRTRGGVLAALTATALLSLASSVGRFLAGDGLWFQAIEGLTPNHKTLAVCLAGWLPLLLSWRQGWAPGRMGPPSPAWQARATHLALALSLAAVLASVSKTAWLGAGLALALAFPRARPLAWRPALLVPALVLGVALAYYSPLLLRSRTMLDAARSRHSLNVRSWQMLRAHPLFGAGTGMSTRVEMATFPHYRINGVDAHGAPQKVGAESGLMGLAGLALFVGGAGRRLLLRYRQACRAAPDQDPTTLPAYGALATFAVLHGQLLLSTELFSPTHWVPLATAWGLAEASLPPRPEDPCAS